MEGAVGVPTGLFLNVWLMCFGAGAAGCVVVDVPVTGEKFDRESGHSFSLAIIPLQQDINFPDSGLEVIVPAAIHP